MQLETWTIGVTIVIAAACMGLMLYLGRLRDGPNRYSSLWALGDGLLAAGWLFLILRGVIPDVVSLVVANGLIAAGFALLMTGTQRFLDESPSWWLGGTIVGITLGGQSLLVWLDAPLSARLTLVPTMVAVLCFFTAWRLAASTDPRTRRARKLTAAVFRFVGVAGLLVSAASALRLIEASRLFEPSAALALLFMSVLIGVVGWSIGFLTLYELRRSAALEGTNRRLEEEVGQRKQAERRQAEIQADYEDLYDRAPDMYGLIDVGSEVFVNCNRTLADRLGCSKADLIGASVFSIYPGDHRAAAETVHRAFDSDDSASPVELQLAGGGDTRVDVELTLTAVRDGDGATRFNRATWRDISERKRIAKALVESERKHEDLINNIGLGIALIDANHNVVMVNKAHLRMFDKQLRQVVGQKCFREFEKRDHVCNHCPGTVAMRTGERHAVESEAVLDNGTRVPVHISAYPTFGEGGEPAGFIEIVEDITERKRVEQELIQAQKMEVVGQLTGGVAHDFNNLLAIASGNLEILKLELAGDPKHQAQVTRALGAIERGASLTRHLLAYSRQQVLVPRQIDLAEVMAEITDMLDQVLTKSIAVTVRCKDNLWPVTVDPRQLETAILNLAINARDAMPDGGELIIETANARIGTAAEGEPANLPPGDYVRLSVQDTGVGIEPGNVGRVFEPFFTTKEIGAGSGLGLSMVYGFAKQSGGQVNVQTDKGVGTTFHLYLPRTQEARQAS